MAETPARALVVEGGGMRGCYAAGVLVELFQQPPGFDAVWATSSGAASSAYGVADQPEAISIWRDHLHGRRLVRPGRFLLGRSALDLEYLIDEVFSRRVPLDIDAMRGADVPIVVPATDVADGTVRYFDLRHRNPLAVLRAAMSLPGAVVNGVKIDGRRYVDGGVVDQVPIARAIESGAEDITVVLTQSPGIPIEPVSRWSLFLASRPFPGLRTVLRQRHVRYARALATLARPPEGVKIRIVQPSRPLKVKRWTTKRILLVEAVEEGTRDARRHVENLGKTS